MTADSLSGTMEVQRKLRPSFQEQQTYASDLSKQPKPNKTHGRKVLTCLTTQHKELMPENGETNFINPSLLRLTM